MFDRKSPNFPLEKWNCPDRNLEISLAGFEELLNSLRRGGLKRTGTKSDGTLGR